MDKREKYTNEDLRKKFTSQFEMVNCAIHCAEEVIKRGTQALDLDDKDNVALYVIDLIENDDPTQVMADLAYTEEDQSHVKHHEEAAADSPNGKKSKRKALS